MTSTPLAMIEHGFTQGQAADVVRWHIVAMFAPSFFTGSVIVRFGRLPVIAAGLVLVGVCGAIALAGVDLHHFYVALFALGIGWNFSFIGATQHAPAPCTRPQSSRRAQGLNDLLCDGACRGGLVRFGRIARRVRLGRRAQLKSGGFEWGVNGNEIVVTLVNKRFINAEISNLTRYGEREEIQLPAGQYTLTCVGLIPEGGLSVDKVLSKGGYFNEDVLSFTIEPGQTTVLDVSSVIRKENTFFLKFFMPEVSVNVVANDIEFGAVPINLRDDRSIGWDDYSGPLKFVAE